MKKYLISLVLTMLSAITVTADDQVTVLYQAVPRATSKIYVQDRSGWSNLCLYAWNETGNMLPWPGVRSTATTTIGGQQWKVLEMPSDYEGRSLNWIFNNGSGGTGNQFDAMKAYTLYSDIFVTINADKSYTVSDVNPDLADAPAEALVEGATTPLVVDNTPLVGKTHQVIYELNLYDFTPEGTLTSATGRLAELRRQNIDIVWLMPIFPRGKVGSIGGVGSPYAPMSYTRVNPDHGTLADLQAFVAEAHRLGMEVWLDWVPNHTSMDAEWLTTHPEYYVRVNGNYYHPNSGSITYGDVYQVDLRDSNPQAQQAMIDAMTFWIDEADIDGFRCDFVVSSYISTGFWNKAIPVLKQRKPQHPVTMLAETDIAQSAQRLFENDWDFDYAWTYEEQLEADNKLASGIATAVKGHTYSLISDKRYGQGLERMLYIDNHDRNDYYGTVYDRFGDNAYAFTVLQNTIFGMPLIYNGNEIGYRKTMNIEHREPIDWSTVDVKMQNTLRTLTHLKHSQPALSHGTQDERGTVNFLITDNADVLAYTRVKDGNTVLVVINFGQTDADVIVTGIAPGHYVRCLDSNTIAQGTTQTEVTLSGRTQMTVKKHGFCVFVH